MLSQILSFENIFLFFSVFLAYFIKSITGFGNTLIMGSLFSFVTSNKVTTPVDLLMSMPTNGYMAWRERKSISFKTAIPLAVLMIIGIIPGIFFLKIGYDWLLKSALGLVIVGMAIQIATRKDDVKPRGSSLSLILIGLISGVLAGVFGIGALVAVYFNKTTDNKQQFRANTCFVFCVENIFRFVLYALTGILNKNIFILTLTFLPAVVLGMMLGIKADKYIDERKLKFIVVILLIFSGATLFVKSAFFH